jgi:CYTH domain-containing protein
MGKEAAQQNALAVMLGKGADLKVGEHKYKVLPLSLSEVEEFLGDNLSVGAQLSNVVTKERQNLVSKWLGRKVFEDGVPMSYVAVTEHNWDLNDLRDCLQLLAGISG